MFYQKFTELKISVTITECKYNFSLLFTPLLNIISYKVYEKMLNVLHTQFTSETHKGHASVFYAS